MPLQWLSWIVILFFVAGFAWLTRRIVSRTEDESQRQMDELKGQLKSLEARKDDLFHQRRRLDAEAHKIFTLYEITRDLIPSSSPQEAFQAFKMTLRDNIVFSECQMVDVLPEHLSEQTDSDGIFVYSLGDRFLDKDKFSPDTKKNRGYLIYEGVGADDKEKVVILSHQFALALRRVRLYREIETMAITDGLTALYTRRYVLERFEEEIKRSRLKKIELAFLMIDIDFFKKFNDTYGHLTGDQVLRDIGVVIKAGIREIDIAGRFGGEEFCVVLPDTDLKGALLAAERIRKGVEAALIQAYDHVLRATVSIGIASLPAHGQSASVLMDKADWAMYKAKKTGRNRVCVFEG